MAYPPNYTIANNIRFLMKSLKKKRKKSSLCCISDMQSLDNMTFSFICGIKVIPLFREINSHRKRRERRARRMRRKKRERVKGLTERGE